jgi:hypothetical protein
MPISVTCECGARLEIDEKFLGKEVPCPDCQRALPTKAPPKPPPLDLPDNRRTSGLAILSLAIGLVGMFTYFIGSLVAIGIGIWAMKVIGRSKKLDGLNLARAGIVVGGIGIFATLVIMITPLGLDGVFRVLAFLDRTTGISGQLIETRDGQVVIKRPSAGHWAIGNQSPNLPVVDDLIVVDVSADAFIAIQHADVGDDNVLPDEDGIRTKVLERLQKSELVNMLGRLSGRPAPEPTVVAQKKENGIQEMTVDMRLGGIDRRFLVMYKTGRKGLERLQVKYFVGCARTSRFERMEPQFREAFEGFARKQ